MRNDLSAEQLRQPITVTLPLGVILGYVEQQFQVNATQAPFANLPAIGATFQGGIYAGLSIENEQPIALVLLPGEAHDLTWEQAKAWAAEKGSLPSRIDALVLFQNLRKHFKEAAYWTDTPYAGYESYAWSQGFSYGDQLYYGQSSKLRAVAVRRINLAI